MSGRKRPWQLSIVFKGLPSWKVQSAKRGNAEGCNHKAKETNSCWHEQKCQFSTPRLSGVNKCTFTAWEIRYGSNRCAFYVFLFETFLSWRTFLCWWKRLKEIYLINVLWECWKIMVGKAFEWKVFNSKSFLFTSVRLKLEKMKFSSLMSLRIISRHAMSRFKASSPFATVSMFILCLFN